MHKRFGFDLVWYIWVVQLGFGIYFYILQLDAVLASNQIRPNYEHSCILSNKFQTKNKKQITSK